MTGTYALRTNLLVGLAATIAVVVASLWPAREIAMALFFLTIVTHMVVLLGGTGWTWGAADPWDRRGRRVDSGWFGAGLMATLLANGVLEAIAPAASAAYPTTMVGTTALQPPNTIAASLAIGMAFATLTELWLRTARRRQAESDATPET